MYQLWYVVALGLRWAFAHRDIALGSVFVVIIITMWRGSLWVGCMIGVAAVLCSFAVQAAAVHNWALCGLLMLVGIKLGRDAYKDLPPYRRIR